MLQKKVLWFISWPESKDNFQTVSENSEFQWEFANQWQDAVEKIRWSLEQKAPFSVAFVDSFERAEWIWKIDSNVQCVVWSDSNWDWAQNFKKFDEWDKWICLKKPFTQWEAWQAAKIMWRKWELEQIFASSNEKAVLGKKVLVVEDEKQIRDMVTEMLTNAGFKVFSASNGEEALRWFDDPSFQIDLCLTDIVMPKVTGIRLAEQLGERYPEIPVVFMSGFPRDAQFQRDVEAGKKRFLQKPFSHDSLRRVLNDAFASNGWQRSQKNDAFVS